MHGPRLLVGVARLSTNWLVRKAAAIYVETLRNIPPLLIILFANNAVLLQLPAIGDAIEVGGLLVISNRELAVAAPVAERPAVAWLVIVFVGLAAALALGAWRERVHDRTGAPARTGLYGVAAVRGRGRGVLPAARRAGDACRTPRSRGFQHRRRGRR